MGDFVIWLPWRWARSRALRAMPPPAPQPSHLPAAVCQGIPLWAHRRSLSPSLCPLPPPDAKKAMLVFSEVRAVLHTGRALKAGIHGSVWSLYSNAIVSVLWIGKVPSVQISASWCLLVPHKLKSSISVSEVSKNPICLSTEQQAGSSVLLVQLDGVEYRGFSPCCAFGWPHKAVGRTEDGIVLAVPHTCAGVWAKQCSSRPEGPDCNRMVPIQINFSKVSDVKISKVYFKKF